MEHPMDPTSYRNQYNLPAEQVTHTTSFLPFHDYHLFYQFFQQPFEAPVVLFLHGFFDHTAVHADWIRYLTRQGYHVAAFDLPGHGRSGGPVRKEKAFTEYREALALVVSELKKKEAGIVHGIGHSTGGAVLADYLLHTEHDSMFEKIVLVSPLIRSNQWYISKIAAPLVSLFRNELPRTFRVSTGAEAFMTQLKKDPLEGSTIPISWVQSMFQWEREMMEQPPSRKPVYILQGTSDQTLEWKHNLKAYAGLFPNSKRILVDEARHHLLNETEARKQMIYRLIRDILREE
ncbi:alpha/beta hydrolase [Salibacterium sp. K-3]